jgi:hypothetical protein
LFPVVVLCVVVGVLAGGALGRISQAEQRTLEDGANSPADIAPLEMSRPPQAARARRRGLRTISVLALS